jgi:hypothetical protein
VGFNAFCSVLIWVMKFPQVAAEQMKKNSPILPWEHGASRLCWDHSFNHLS